MKLDVNVLRYLTRDDFRVLTAVEMGQKNHELVPLPLIDSISGLKHGGAYKCLRELLKHKLVHHESGKYDGYRLTYMGYDFLALRALTARGHISGVGRQIGMGKESDIFEVTNDAGEVFALKLHRLGRTSFRAVKNKRDYVGNRSSYSWLYLSRLAALKEHAFMRALWDAGFPVPQAIDHNRHAVLMTRVEAYPMVQVNKLSNPGQVYLTCMELISRLASKGLIHCDFNEFNLLLSEDEEVTLIDFPQMVSVSHANAQDMFDRDVECIIKFFHRKIGYRPEDDPALPYVRPSLQDAIAAVDEKLDVGLYASGFKRKHERALEEAFVMGQGGEGGSEESDDGASDSEQEEDEGEEQEGREAGATAQRGPRSALADDQAAAADLQGGECAGPSGSSGGRAPSAGASGSEVAGAGQEAAARRTRQSQAGEDEEEAGSSSSSSSGGGSSSGSGSDDEGREEERERLQQRRDALQQRKLEQLSLSRRTAQASLGERDVQARLAQERRRDVKKQSMVVRTSRNSSKAQKGKGTHKGKGGGGGGGGDFGGW